MRDEDDPVTKEEYESGRRWMGTDENVDFLLGSATAADGIIWTWLRCSVHGNMQASTQWDLEMVNVAAITHYVRKHLRKNKA